MRGRGARSASTFRHVMRGSRRHAGRRCAPVAGPRPRGRPVSITSSPFGGEPAAEGGDAARHGAHGAPDTESCSSLTQGRCSPRVRGRRITQLCTRIPYEGEAERRARIRHQRPPADAAHRDARAAYPAPAGGGSSPLGMASSCSRRRANASSVRPSARQIWRSPRISRRRSPRSNFETNCLLLADAAGEVGLGQAGLAAHPAQQVQETTLVTVFFMPGGNRRGAPVGARRRLDRRATRRLLRPPLTGTWRAFFQVYGAGAGLALERRTGARLRRDL